MVASTSDPQNLKLTFEHVHGSNEARQATRRLSNAPTNDNWSLHGAAKLLVESKGAVLFLGGPFLAHDMMNLQSVPSLIVP